MATPAKRMRLAGDGQVEAAGEDTAGHANTASAVTVPAVDRGLTALPPAEHGRLSTLTECLALLLQPGTAASGHV